MSKYPEKKGSISSSGHACDFDRLKCPHEAIHLCSRTQNVRSLIPLQMPPVSAVCESFNFLMLARTFAKDR